MFEPSEGHDLPEEGPIGDDLDPIAAPGGVNGPQGNRPADGASVGSPDDLSAGGDWSGEDAGDFLGLGGSAAPPPGPAEDGAEPEAQRTETTSALADAPELEEGDFESWLTDEDEDSASWLMELEDDPGSDAFDPERLEAEFGIDTGTRGPSRGGWILRLGLVAAGLGAGFLGSRWYGEHYGGGATDQPIARVESPTPRTGAPDAAAGGATSATGDATTDATTDATGDDTATTDGADTNTEANANPGSATSGASDATGVADGNSTGRPETPVGTGPANDVPTRPADPTSGPTAGGPATDATTPLAGSGGSIDVEGGAGATNETPGKTGGGNAFTMPVEDMVVVPRVEGSPVAYASDEEMAAMWRSAEIPLGRVNDEDRLLTPRVGRVRVAIHGGEIFEGRLYAVGENRVWLETGSGKMALMGWQVDRIEHLPEVDAPVLGEKGSQDLAGLKSVRVRTPGGVFYGKLLDEHEGEVTLITESGGRLRLSNARVEPAGKSRTRIVDPGGAQPQEATSKGEED